MAARSHLHYPSGLLQGPQERFYVLQTTEMTVEEREEARQRLLEYMRSGGGALDPLAAQHLQPICSEQLGIFMEASRAQTGFCASTLVASQKYGLLFFSAFSCCIGPDQTGQR